MQEGRECDIEAELLERGRDRKWEKENSVKEGEGKDKGKKMAKGR
jgi:hypothetical protein